MSESKCINCEARPVVDLQRGLCKVCTPLQGLKDQLAFAEIEIIEKAIIGAQGNVSAAARALGIPRRSLYNRLKALGYEEKDIRMLRINGLAAADDES